MFLTADMARAAGAATMPACNGDEAHSAHTHARKATHLRLFELLLLLNPQQNLAHIRLELQTQISASDQACIACAHHHAAHDELVEDVMHLFNVKDEVQLAHVLEAAVERLHEYLYKVENAELALRRVHAEDEIERRVVAVDQLVVGAAY